MSLRRKLGFWDVFCIASGAMISSGLFVLPGIAYARAGPAVVLAYGLAAMLAIPAAMCQAELATAMPRSGGSYFFIERSMGALPGTFAGLANWFSISLKASFALIGIGAFAGLVRPDVSPLVIKLIAVACCVGFATLNILSVKHAGRLQVVLVAALIAILAGFIAAGLPEVRHDAFRGFMGKGPVAILATAGLVFVSFGGLTKVASVAGEVRLPGRNIPAGMFAALGVVSVLYVLAVFVTEGVLDGETLSGSLTPLSLAAGAFFGTAGVVLLAGAAMLAFITTANSGILTASRSPMAMSHDGLLPPMFRKLSRRYQTPYVSILLTSGFMITVIVLLDIASLVKAASAMMLLLFILSNLAVIVMRSSRIQNYRPLYRVPLTPWLQIAGILIYAVLIVQMGLIPLVTTGAFAAAGIVWYLLYVRPRTSRESALLYRVRQVLSKEMVRSGLEDELREIALERDEVTHDRFDELIRNCAILDLPGRSDADDMLRQSATILARRRNLDEQRLYERLRERELEGTTVIQPGLAIPHVVVPGEHVFDVLLVRCREGIDFPGQDRPVHIAFVLAGSPDERNYHLRALMAIAHITQEPTFTRRWLGAPGEEHLRDIVLLSHRPREA
jgi:amino acid transporter/mannitol/fructose-specific phosphotransferase system IIA component (Ntr-type)